MIGNKIFLRPFESKSADLKMAEYSKKVNKYLIYIFLLFCIITQVKSKEEYIPALIWTSKEYEGRKNVDDWVTKKINSDLFVSYLKEFIKDGKGPVVVFLEDDLSTEDFEWGDERGGNYPFLSYLAANSRVDYFRSVQSPYKSLVGFFKKYSPKYLKPDTDYNFKKNDLVFVEFDKIKTQRSRNIRYHDYQIEKIYEQLVDSGRSWICIYTARNVNDNNFKKKQLNPWFVEDTPIRKIHFYRDEFTGITLMKKGSIQLQLPFHNSTVKILENYLGTSVKSSHHKIDFVIWFVNCTLTFHLKEANEEWKVNDAKLTSGEGNNLMLTIQGDSQVKNNYHIQTTEIKSEGETLVLVFVSKSKLSKFQFYEKTWRKPYGFYITFSAILISIVTVVICWKKMLDKLDFSVNGSVVRIPTENLWSISSKTVF